MVKVIIQNYAIVEKQSTRILLRTIQECNKIYDCWSILSEAAQKETNDILNIEINRKLQKCFNFYHRKYAVEIETGYGMKDIEINISNICETIKSWEEENKSSSQQKRGV